jgi:hypothetical protein
MALMEQTKYYFEFIGAHGSGKTYTYHLIAKKNLLRPLKAIYPGQVCRPKLHFMVFWPVIACKNIHHIIFVINFFLKHSQFRLVNFRVLRSLIKMIILHPYYSRFDFDVLVKDDMLHLLLRVLFKTDTNIGSAYEEYFHHFSYLYSGFVFVETLPTIILDRFKHRFPNKNNSFKSARLVVHKRSIQQSAILKQVIEKQRIVPFVIIDGAGDGQTNAEKVSVFINQTILKKS